MFKDVLVPIDLNDEAIWERALATAVEMAQAFGTRLHALSVVPDLNSPLVANYFPANYEAEVLERAREQLDDCLRRHVPSGVEAERLVAEGTVYREIIKAARSTGCDLILMGSHHPAFQDFLLGSNAQKVVSHAECSVMVIRNPKPDKKPRT